MEQMKVLEDTKLVVRMKFGSHLYGIATSDSDIDYKGVFLPSKEQILLGRIPKCHSWSTGEGVSKNRPGDVDVETYSLHYFIMMACEGQMVALDMLHAPDSLIVESSDIWKSIVGQRHRFYTKSLKTLISYARRQAAKYGIKGSRLNATATVLGLLKAEDPSHALRSIWNKLPLNEYCFESGIDPQGLRRYQVCGKQFQESAAIGYVAPVLEKFCEEYGKRARLAAENRNIDWKAVSHALRAAFQIKEILTSATVTFPLKEAEFLLQVKEGSLDYLTEVAPVLEKIMEEVEKLAVESVLPETVDRLYWDKFICDTLDSELFRCS
jgi:hypothetical protein